ncbi:MAG: hypothetical protein AB7O52_09180 [Planctomycetota bacterium]
MSTPSHPVGSTDPGTVPEPESLPPSRALQLITWWRCLGCFLVIVVLGLGVLLGVFAGVSSQFFSSSPLDLTDSPASDEDGAAVARNLTRAAREGTALECEAPEFEALVSFWLRTSSEAGPRSAFRCRFVSPGVLRVQTSLEVPSGLGFPAGLLAGRFLNAEADVSGTLDRTEPERVGIHRYRVGGSEEVAAPTAGTGPALAATMERLLRYHPTLDRRLERLGPIEVLDAKIRVRLR